MEINVVSSHQVEIYNLDPPTDNFYTPTNQEFYTSSPYLDLDLSEHKIRLLGLESSDIDLRDQTLYVKERAFADFHDNDFQEDWRSIGDLLASEFWRRGWVYQEVLVA